MAHDPDQIDIDYLAQLARIELNEKEKNRFSQQLSEILEHFKKIDAIDVTGVEPMAHAFPVQNVWEDDQPESPLERSQALQNAPAQKDGSFIVPRVVEE